MEVTVLVVPDCPGGRVLLDRLERVLGPDRAVQIQTIVVNDLDHAERVGMRGSPTLLLDGVDPFAQPVDLLVARPSISCRLYRDPAGRRVEAPSIEELRQALSAEEL